MVYSYSDIENAYKVLKQVVERENKLHMMDQTIIPQHLDDLQYEILPMLEEIVYFDPTPWQSPNCPLSLDFSNYLCYYYKVI